MNMYGIDNILQFIDSQAIRDYVNENTFTAGEWAVLISKSSQPISAKIDALKKISICHGDKGLCPKPDCPAKECMKRNILLRDIIWRTIDFWNYVLSKREDANNVVFAATHIEKGHDDGSVVSYRYFTNYDAAYRYIKRKKQRYLDDEFLKEIITYGEILRISLDNDDHCVTESYYFDHNLELNRVNAEKEPSWADASEIILTDCFVYVPLPFKKGDKVKIDYGCEGTQIAEIAYDPEERLKVFVDSCENENDDWLSVWMQMENGRELEWTYDHVISRSLDYATVEECAGIPKCPLKWKN